MNDLISVIIVNYNGKRWLKKCFDSLQNQTYKHYEIIFVDNASSDDSVEYIRTRYPTVKIVVSKKNLGFAGGNSLGIKSALGNYILLLNNDTFVLNSFLAYMLEAFRVIPNLGSVQSKIILMNEKNRLDVCGSYWTSTSFLYHFGMNGKQNKKEYNIPTPFFSNKGASMMIKRSVIDKIGFLDDDFWSYYEETDLCHRIWIAGYECWYYPKAVIYHAVGGTAVTFPNSFIQYHNFKNKLLSFLKNFEFFTLIKIIPIYLVINIALSFFWLLQGKFKHLFALYRSIGWNIIHIKKTLMKRRKTQGLRKKSDDEIFLITKKNPRITYYYYLLTGKSGYED